MKMTAIKYIKLWQFWLVLSAVYCLTVTIMEFHGVPVTDFYSFRTVATHYAVVVFLTMGLLLILSCNRIVSVITIPPLFLISGVMCYFNLSIGTRLTPVAIELAAVNGMSMWWSVITPGLMASALASLAAGILFAAARWKYVKAPAGAQLVALFLGILMGPLPMATISRLYAPVSARLPYSIYFSCRDYLRNRRSFNSHRDNFEQMPAKASEDSPEVIFILGETLRADHLPFNGYGRNTMPLLSRLDNVISFPTVYSEYSYTDRSVPHILTAADSLHPDRADEEQSFITLFRNAGYRTCWIANQDLSRAYTYFAHEADSLIYCNADRSFYSYEKWFDSDMTEPLRKWLEGVRRDNVRPLSVLHTIGSHWWYKSHYSESQAIFRPEVTHKDPGGMTKAQMVNSYDNTIIATDEFLAQVYNLVKDRNAVIFFISDHGEALGENGVYLHAEDIDELHYPACLIIYSPEYARRFPKIVDALRKDSGKRYTTDNIFHTILDLAGITTPALDRSRSMAGGRLNEKN